ncbi:hypothetical protein ACFQVD_34500 [Streptosporangium amethystogenes subsp. fukuiense]|uniref:Uncharacterized protein n=1 Tax=Streptosporangium amethystogenes subsp. fukuiense TaxID=698418 RepID=A0ABW2TB46_9ACTN
MRWRRTSWGAIGAYGGAALVRADEEAADATVGWGRTLPRCIFEVTATEEEIPEAVTTPST